MDVDALKVIAALRQQLSDVQYALAIEQARTATLADALATAQAGPATAA